METGRELAWRTGPGRRARPGKGGAGGTPGRLPALPLTGGRGHGGRGQGRAGLRDTPQAPSALPVTVTGGRGLAAQSQKLLFRRRTDRPFGLPTATRGAAAGQTTCFQRPSLPNPGSVPSGPEHLSTPTLAGLPAQPTVNLRPTPLTRQEGRAGGQRSGDPAKGSASVLAASCVPICAEAPRSTPCPLQGCAGLRRRLGAERGPCSLPAPGTRTPPSCFPLLGPGSRPARA